jgi:hypothetical protein
VSEKIFKAKSFYCIPLKFKKMQDPGSIPDPRMNPKEYRYGIIEVNGKLFAYDKKNKRNKKRSLPGGFVVILPKKLKTKKLDKPIIWYGNKITREVLFKEKHVLKSLKYKKQGPIALKVYPLIDGLRENKLWPKYSSELKK